MTHHLVLSLGVALLMAFLLGLAIGVYSNSIVSWIVDLTLDLEWQLRRFREFLAERFDGPFQRGVHDYDPSLKYVTVT